MQTVKLLLFMPVVLKFHMFFFLLSRLKKGSGKKQNCSDTQCCQYNSDTYWQITITTLPLHFPIALSNDKLVYF